MVSPDERGHKRAARRSLVVDKAQHARIHCTHRTVPPSAGSGAVSDTEWSSLARSVGDHLRQLPGKTFCLAGPTIIDSLAYANAWPLRVPLDRNSAWPIGAARPEEEVVTEQTST